MVTEEQRAIREYIALLDILFKGGTEGFTLIDLKEQLIGSYPVLVYDDYIEFSNHSRLKVLSYVFNGDYPSEYFECVPNCFYNYKSGIGKRITSVSEPYKTNELYGEDGENESHALINFYSNAELVLTISLIVKGCYGHLDETLFLELNGKHVKVLSTDD